MVSICYLRLVFGTATNDPTIFDAFILGPKENVISLYKKIGQTKTLIDSSIQKGEDLPSPIPVSSQEPNSNAGDFFLKSITGLSGNIPNNGHNINQQTLKSTSTPSLLTTKTNMKSGPFPKIDANAGMPFPEEGELSEEYSSPTISQDFKSNAALGLHRAGLTFSTVNNDDTNINVDLFKGCVICVSQRLWVQIILHTLASEV